MILVTGGTGFIGSRLVKRLLRRGEKTRCLVRKTSKAEELKKWEVDLFYGDLTIPSSLKGALEGVEVLIHLAAIIRESKEATFEGVNYQGTKTLIVAAKEAGVKRVIYMSVLGASPDESFPFLHSKWKGEEEVRRSGLDYTILRSSIIFGEGDRFINTLARIVKKTPLVPIIGSGKVSFQPLWVGDALSCILQSLEESSTVGKTIPIGGQNI